MKTTMLKILMLSNLQATAGEQIIQLFGFSMLERSAKAWLTKFENLEGASNSCSNQDKQTTRDLTCNGLFWNLCVRVWDF